LFNEDDVCAEYGPAQQFRQAVPAVRCRQRASIFVRKELCAGIGSSQQFRQAVPAVRCRQRAYIFVRKTLQVRLRDHKSVSFCKLGGQDLRFSMKMMFAPDQDLRDSLSELLHTFT